MFLIKWQMMCCLMFRPDVCKAIPELLLSLKAIFKSGDCKSHSIVSTPSFLLQALLLSSPDSFTPITGAQGDHPLICEKPVADLSFLANASQAPQCWAVSIVRTTGRQALRPPSWSLFLIVWVETFTPVACCWSFCRARANLNMFHLAQRNGFLQHLWMCHTEVIG